MTPVSFVDYFYFVLVEFTITNLVFLSSLTQFTTANQTVAAFDLVDKRPHLPGDPMYKTLKQLCK